MVSEQDVLDALQSIVGPDGKTPLPQTGSIAGVTVKEGKVFLSIRIEAREAPTMETLRVAAEKAIRAIPGVTTALVSLTAEKPAAAKPPNPAPAPGPARPPNLREMTGKRRKLFCRRQDLALKRRGLVSGMIRCRRRHIDILRHRITHIPALRADKMGRRLDRICALQQVKRILRKLS